MATIFTKIINGDLPGHFMLRDDLCVAFLSINPLAAGHTLVVPRAEVDHWLDLDPALNQHLMAVAQRVGRAQETVFHPDRVGLIIAGFEVPHVHVHVIPANSMAALDFSNAQATVDDRVLADQAAQLTAALA